MKKFIIGAMAVFVIIMFGSCSQKLIIPRAVNTINSVTLGELNLERNNYEILNNITADALISYVDAGTYIEISDMNNEFSLRYTKNKKGEWQCRHSGILKFGYLNNDSEIKISEMIEPEEIVRRMAIYRIINIAQLSGADGIIEPTVSTSIEQVGRSIIFKTTIVAKIIKLKTDVQL